MTTSADDKDQSITDILLLIWVHGFKGTDVTFEDFPDRISTILEETHPKLRVYSHVFPAYETRGELTQATEKFVDWLTTKVVEVECGAVGGRGAGSAKIALMGHSMGGLLIADATDRIASTTREDDPLWPNVIATIAFDTPYLGLHPHVFKHQLSQAASHVETARSVASDLAKFSPLVAGFGFAKATQSQAEQQTKQRSEIAPNSDKPSGSSWWSSSSGRAVAGFGALALGAAAAGTAYYRRNDLSTGWKYGYDHMTFVKNLWDNDGLRNRLQCIDKLARTRNVLFTNYFTLLPPVGHSDKRTFAIQPSASDPLSGRWRPATNTKAADEVSAHVGMFNPRTNDGFYDLGLAVVGDIGGRLEQDTAKAGRDGTNHAVPTKPPPQERAPRQGSNVADDNSPGSQPYQQDDLLL